MATIFFPVAEKNASIIKYKESSSLNPLLIKTLFWFTLAMCSSKKDFPLLSLPLITNKLLSDSSLITSFIIDNSFSLPENTGISNEREK